MSEKDFYDCRIHDQLDSRYLMTTAQSIRLQLVIELIRAGKIYDFLSLAHEAEQFVLNGMENKPMDSHAESNSSWPQTKEEVVSDPSIKEKFNEKWKVKAPPKCMMPGSTIEPLPLAEMCETIIKHNGKDEVVAGEWTLRNENQSCDLLQHGCCVNYPESKVRNILMGFPPFNRNLPVDPSQEEVHGGGESAEPQMTLWEMCEAIIGDPDLDNLAPNDWILTKDNATGDFTLFQPQSDGDAGAFTIVADLEKAMIKRDISIREILMRFPPFKK